MLKASRILAAAGLAMSLMGCVSQNEYDRLYAEVDSLTNRNKMLAAEADKSKAERDAAMNQLARTEQGLEDLKRVNAELLQKLRDLGQNMSDLESRMNNIKGLGALDPETDALLRQLAAEYPDLLTYDADKGMVRFNSDLTFGSGDDTVKDNARQALSALANILKNPKVAQYEVQIIGHTDSQPITASARRHPTNLHLSVHRAVAVDRVLQQDGVDAGRMMAGGYGPWRPMVANSANGNTPQNRRVEIYLTKMKGVLPNAGDISDNEASAPATAPAKSTTARPSREAAPKKPAEIVK